MWQITENISYDSDKINEELKVSPWAVNRDFAYDLVKYFKPENICELGSFYGCSLFAFAQSIKDNGIKSKIFAIDTWEGDIHAGYYGDEVINSVKEIKHNYFKTVDIELIRNRFEVVKDDFEDEFFDLIHIDGLHTYEATKTDFENYLPKLKENGIILFHDISNTSNYGSSKFWEEISAEFPSLTLDFSWGLGVLFPKGAEVFYELLSEGIENIIQIYIYRSLYELECIKNNDVNTLLLKREEIMNKMDYQISERDKAIKANEILIKEKDKALKSMSEMIESRDEAINAEKDLIDKKDELIKSMEMLINEKSHTIKELTKLIDARDTAIKANELLIDEKDKAIKSMSVMIDTRDEAIEAEKHLVDKKDVLITEYENLITELKDSVRNMNTMIEDRDSAIRSMTTMIEDRDSAIVSMTKMIDARDDVIRSLEMENMEVND